MAEKRIEVSNLRVSYGAHEVLKGISFDVYDKEILAVIGPAQSGKTTMLKALNRTLEFVPGASRH
jgi:ABC-type phosphate transport system ATPase subunit